MVQLTTIRAPVSVDNEMCPAVETSADVVAGASLRLSSTAPSTLEISYKTLRNALIAMPGFLNAPAVRGRPPTAPHGPLTSHRVGGDRKVSGQTVMDDVEAGLLRVPGAGRGVLPFGQEYIGFVTQDVLCDVAADFKVRPAGEILSPLLENVAPADVPSLRRPFDLHLLSKELVELAAIPWLLLLTSAVESTPIEGFRWATVGGRRLRLLFPVLGVTLLDDDWVLTPG